MEYLLQSLCKSYGLLMDSKSNTIDRYLNSILLKQFLIITIVIKINVKMNLITTASQRFEPDVYSWA